MRLGLRNLLPFTPLAIPAAALVAYWKPVMDWLTGAPDAPKSFALHTLVHHATSWTLVVRGAHIHPREVFPVVAGLLFVVAVRVVLAYYRHRPRTAYNLDRGRTRLTA